MKLGSVGNAIRNQNVAQSTYHSRLISIVETELSVIGAFEGLIWSFTANAPCDDKDTNGTKCSNCIPAVPHSSASMAITAQVWRQITCHPLMLTWTQAMMLSKSGIAEVDASQTELSHGDVLMHLNWITTSAHVLPLVSDIMVRVSICNPNERRVSGHNFER